MRWVDPDWWEKHPNGGKDSLNFEEALKAIMKATGAKMNKKEEEKKTKRGKTKLPLSLLTPNPLITYPISHSHHYENFGK